MYNKSVFDFSLRVLWAEIL